ncbi:MAG: gamma-glutamylcyclotransferase family protein [Pseudomonadota bacterium]
MGYFIGYGSLVNRRTHAFADVHPARLTGWRRMWRRTDRRAAAYLTVVPDTGCEIEGLVAAVPAGDWAALDLREAAYARIAARHQIDAPLPSEAQVVVYAIEDGLHHPPDTGSPVLLSYIDVVVQGYLHMFGEDGVARFFDTTGGWEAPVLDDRASPIYSRHQELSAQETALVDDMLARVGARLR